jgi:hypothetical protein
MSETHGSELKAERRLKRRAAAQQTNGEQSASEPPIAFVHIPKTAGGTLKSVLAEAFGRDALQDGGNYLRNPDKTGAQSFRFRPGQRVTIGHIHYGLYREHLPGDTRYITFLRDPVDRVISHYYRHLPGKTETLRDALESGMPQLTNLMTRFLCGHTDILGDLPDSALDDAKASLESFAFVGFQERFDESLLLLLERLGVPQLAYGASRHVNDDRPSLDELSDEERAVIASHNQLDVELYRWARSRFDAELEARGDDFRAAVESLRDESAAKAAHQARRTELAVEWLTEALPAGTSRSQQELLAEAELAGFTLAELKRAKRQLKPACRNRFMDDGLYWELRLPGEAGKRVGERRRRERRPAGASTSPPADELDERGPKRERKQLRRQAAQSGVTAEEPHELSTGVPDEPALKSERKKRRREMAQRVGAAHEPRPEPPIAFVHIPKTAGGTLKSVFADAFGREAIHNAGNYLVNAERTAERASKLGPKTRFTLGHVPYGLFKPHLPPETRYITFLREPVERVISHWFRHLDGKAGSLPEALEGGTPAVTNLMTRFLCGHADVLGDLPESALDDAKASLESFVFVGFQDRFDESLLLLQERLGMPMTAYGASVHVNADRPGEEEVGEETLALIEKHNQLDVELYAWARDRFGGEFDARRDELGTAVETLRGAIAQKAAGQDEGIERALKWLTEQVPPGTEQPIKELLLEAHKMGLTTRDFQRARRQMNPPSRKRTTDRGVMLVVAPHVRGAGRANTESQAAD